MARTPDLATTKDRMLAASSIEVLRRFLIGTAVEIIASDYDDVEYDSGESFPPSLALRTYLHP